MSRGLERACGHLAAAAAELEAACRAWGVWADEVRERAEQRLGTGPADPRVCCDPEYARALDAGQAVHRGGAGRGGGAAGRLRGCGRVRRSWRCGPGDGNRFTSFLIAANEPEEVNPCAF